MEQRARRYRLWLCFALGQAHSRIASLLAHYQEDAEAVFRDAKHHCLPELNQRDAGLNRQLYEKAEEGYIDRCLAYMERHKIQGVLLGDANYPILLTQIHRPPTCLYVRGRLPEVIHLPIAMIGSRNCSEYGKRVAMTMARDFSSLGVCVVSGLAHGIDGLCAKGALAAVDNLFPTIAVLGCGVDVVYPPQNRELYEQVVERGAVVSEFLPGEKPLPAYFPQRNRIISGLSKGVVVVEAALHSGTNITVEFALEQNRDVFAIPGRPSDEKSKGTNRLIKEGNAKSVTDVWDVLEEYNIQPGQRAAPKWIDESRLSLEQTLLVRLLQAGERNIDELCELTGYNAPEINLALTDMELSGIIKQSPGRLFSLE